MTATFWTVAALLCAVAVAILLVPVWRVRRGGGPWSLVGLAVAAFTAPLALALYSYVSNWDPEYAARASRETELVDQLARRLESAPNDLEGWRLLAASYIQLGRYVDGRAAYERLWALTPQPSDELKLAYAESQILTDRGSLTGEAGRLVEEVLAANPGEPKALWYGGLVALELGRNDLCDLLGRVQRQQALPTLAHHVVPAELEGHETAVPQRLRLTGVRREHFLDETPRLARQAPAVGQNL